MINEDGIDMTWNYRIGTEIYEYTLGGEIHKERVFFCYNCIL